MSGEGARRGPPARGEPIPWLVIILVTGLFFLAEHHLQTRSSLDSSAAIDMRDAALEAISEGSVKRQFAFVTFGMLGLLGLVWRPRWRLEINGARSWAVIMFLGWAVLSLGWADDRALTMRRLGVLALICLGISGILRQFSRRQIVVLITVAALGYLLIGIGNELAVGAFTPLGADYRFSGTLHPGEQAINCSILALGALCLADGAERGRRRWLAIAAFAFAFLVLTKSRTGTASALFGGLVYWGVGARGHRVRTLVVTLGAGGLLLLGLLLVLNQVVPMPWDVVLMGRGTAYADTLSGRVPLWELLLRSAARRPFLGYGFNSFMSVQHAAHVIAVLAWGFNSAHSVYLDVLLGLGAIGLGLFVAVLGLATHRAVHCARLYRDPTFAFFAALIVFEILTGFLDSTLMFPGPRMWTLLVIGSLAFRDPYEGVPDEPARGDPRPYELPMSRPPRAGVATHAARP